MQLENVKISSLFGRFRYEINLHRPEKITIIHAPNGFGKTVLLNLINAFFGGQFSLFFKYHFSSISFRFDNSETVTIEKIGQSDLFNKQGQEERREIHVSLATSSGERERVSV
jgi:predicted ATP-binding protein involved in virulence